MLIHQNKTRGFTLIEMMISVGLFTVVMVMALGVIASIIDGNKKAQAINTVANNLNFAVDSMVRDIKTGYAYSCGGISSVSELKSRQNEVPGTTVGHICNGSVAAPALALISTISGPERAVEYYYDPIQKSIMKNICSPTCGIPLGYMVRVTSPEIEITNFQLYVSNPPSEDVTQPGVLLILSGTVKGSATPASNFNIQTFISQRLLNI